MAFPWFRKRQAPQLAPAVETVSPSIVLPFDPDSVALMSQLLSQVGSAALERKDFDWQHYLALTQNSVGSLYQGEFNALPTIRALKTLTITDHWINACMNAVARQFMIANLMLKKQTDSEGNEQQVKNHPFLSFMKKAGPENASFFQSNNILELCGTGNNYWYISPDLKNKQRLPADRVDVVIRENEIKAYTITAGTDGVFTPGTNGLTLLPDEVVHLRMPNPFSIHVGLSMLIALNLPVLIQKYGLEYIAGFFLRGGNTAGVIETSVRQADQLTRLAKSIMLAFGGRRNMHADKVLPEGAKWVGQGHTFSEIQLREMLKDNLAAFRAATGCTNVVLGMSESVTRATAYAEMQMFWKMTILPLQNIYCSGIMSSPLWRRFGFDDSWALCFDNSNVEWLDDFDLKLEQDVKLSETWTVNERRERLGKEAIVRFGDKLATELKPAAPGPLGFSLSLGQGGAPASSAEAVAPQVEGQVEESADVWESMELKIQEPEKGVDNAFHREFAVWETIVLANLGDKSAARKAIRKRAKDFSTRFAKSALPAALKAYEHQMETVVTDNTVSGSAMKAHRNAKGQITRVEKISEQDRRARLSTLRERAAEALKTEIFKSQLEHFYGYSDTRLDDVYGLIKNVLSDGYTLDDGTVLGTSLDDAAVAVRAKFGEFYEGQAKTIVRTEFGSAVSIGQQKFAQDLASVCSRMSKEWVTMGDEDVRDEHKKLGKSKPIEGPADKIPNEFFQLDGADYLRFPRETTDDAGKVVNCRCSVRYRVVEWGE